MPALKNITHHEAHEAHKGNKIIIFLRGLRKFRGASFFSSISKLNF